MESKSVNINGIIYYFTEAAADSLQQYRQAVHLYFQNFEDGISIIESIDERIAELLLQILNEGKTLLDEHDVLYVKEQLGEIEGFQEDSEQGFFEGEKTKPQQSFKEYLYSRIRSIQAPTFSGTLYRDVKRRKLAGLCAGIAYYFRVDPVVVRLILLFTLYHSVNNFDILALLLGVGYLLGWIIVPENGTLPQQGKYLLRSGRRKIITGTCTGISHHLGIEPVFAYLFFIIGSVAYPSLLWLYFGLWLSIPKARSISERLQSNGVEMTLNNIRSHFDERSRTFTKQGIPVEHVQHYYQRIYQEVKHVTLPQGLLQQLARIVAMLTGITLLMVLLVSVPAVYVALDFLLTNLHDIKLDLQGVDLSDKDLKLLTAILQVLRDLPFYLKASVFATTATPLLLLLVISLSLIVYRWILSKRVTVALLLAWMVITLGGGLTAGQYALNFHTVGSFIEKVNIPITNSKQPIVLLSKEEEEGGSNNLNTFPLSVFGQENEGVVVKSEFQARGRTRQDAIQNAKTTSYYMTVEENAIQIDPYVKLASGAEYRMQEMNMAIGIPIGKPFKVGLKNVQNQYFDPEETYIFMDKYKVIPYEDYLQRHIPTQEHFIPITPNGITCTPSIQDPTLPKVQQVVIKDIPYIEMYQGNNNKVVVKEQMLEQLDFVVKDDELFIVPKSQGEVLHVNTSDTLKIFLNTLKALSVSGKSNLNVGNFKDLEEVKINLDEYVNANFEHLDADHIVFSSAGNTNTLLKGDCNQLNIKAQDYSNIDCSNMKTPMVMVKATDFSNVKAYASEQGEVIKRPTAKVVILGTDIIIRRQ
ncbi:PspC domain-containing protein [Algivirga pacifica]